MINQQNPSRRTSFPLGPFEVHPDNPIMRPRGESWESANVYNPAAIVRGDEVVLLYRAHATDLVSHIGYASSPDGYRFERRAAPVVSPSEPYDVFGCEDPRVTEVGGTYYLTYTGWDRVNARLCLATSTDLVDWTKHGPLFGEFNTFLPAVHSPSGAWSKAGGILPEPIGGRYLMYFGEGSIFHAWSDDLIRWEPCAQDDPLLEPEPGTFTEFLVEVGPPPLLLDDGHILLIHNAATRDTDGTVHYSCGQLLIDPARPNEVLAQLSRPWLEPSTFEDTHGLVANVTFVEGLVHFRDRWLAYYGQSDSTIGVATSHPGATFSPYRPTS